MRRFDRKNGKMGALLLVLHVKDLPIPTSHIPMTLYADDSALAQRSKSDDNRSDLRLSQTKNASTQIN